LVHLHLFVHLRSAQLGWGRAPVDATRSSALQFPAHDEKTDAVVLYSEINVSCSLRTNQEKPCERRTRFSDLLARLWRKLLFPSTPTRRYRNFHGWCIPAQGKDYEVKDKDGMEVSLPKIEGSELVSDVKAKLLKIPASDPGNIVGYEYEREIRPFVLQDFWSFQGKSPFGRATTLCNCRPGGPTERPGSITRSQAQRGWWPIAVGGERSERNP
jgi:hypothetical protein